MNPNIHDAMNCAESRDRLALLLYGELSFDEEERVETHLGACPECRLALAGQRRLHEAIDGVEVTASPALLNQCREEFSERLAAQIDVKGGAGSRPGVNADTGQTRNWWRRMYDSVTVKGTWTVGAWKPAGALTLIAIGFFAARVTPFMGSTGGFEAASLASLGPSQIRSISPASDGRVSIVYDESRSRTVSGTLEDDAVRALLLSAAKGSSDPGLRAETVAILVNGAGAADVREALVFALEHDRNSAVRLRAMDGLRSYADDPAVQGALAQVLLRDDNRGLRTQAIDLLTQRGGDDLNRQIVGVLQELMGREDDTYVRERCQKVLQSVRASAEIY